MRVKWLFSHLTRFLPQRKVCCHSHFRLYRPKHLCNFQPLSLSSQSLYRARPTEVTLVLLLIIRAHDILGWWLPTLNNRHILMSHVILKHEHGSDLLRSFAQPTKIICKELSAQMKAKTTIANMVLYRRLSSLSSCSVASGAGTFSHESAQTACLLPFVSTGFPKKKKKNHLIAKARKGRPRVLVRNFSHISHTW